MSMLDELFSGNICPADKYAKKGGEYQRLISRLSDYTDRLLPMLNDEASALWDEIRETDHRMEGILEKESFIDGFCIGARLMLEIMETDRTNREIL